MPADPRKQSQELLERTTAGRVKMVAAFQQLHQFLEDQEKPLLAQMKEVEEEIERGKKEVSSFDTVIQEMEEKCRQPATELLKDIKSAMQRYKEKVKSEKPVPFPWKLKLRILDFRDLNLFLEDVMEHFRDSLVSGLQLRK
ncbi:tripartite motif-containing protein 10-like isoform X2 [Rhineura floridana]|nr:tripartite motif-containing protein 10-like isoform X2 [Rhineura floridana]